MRYLLYNSLSGKSHLSYQNAVLHFNFTDAPKKMIDITKIESIGDFIRGLDESDELYVFGGDGTLNIIANAMSEDMQNKVYYYPSGTGNDFARDIGAGSEKPVLVNDYLRDLPTVTVKGKNSKFINGVGFGIDGYCCAQGDIMKSKNNQPNYAAIAIEGLLFHYKPVNAKVTVDGVTKEFKNVWLAPTMYGRYYGGGMMPTPEQDRSSDEKSVSIMIFHGAGKLKTLMIFPSLFKGEHVKYTNHVAVMKGKSITVEFDRPTPLQIDGETVLDVNSYTATV